MPAPLYREEVPKGLERLLKEVLKSSGSSNNNSHLVVEAGPTYRGINLEQLVPHSNR